MSSFAEDIYREILARLPVKSILTCKCVCKFWFELISNPSFMEMQLNHAKQRNNTRLMFTGFHSRGENIINSVSYDSLLFSETNDVNIVKIDCPFNVLDCSYKLVGSCNGLVCLWRCGYPTLVCLIWNPATKEYKKIPKSPYKYIKCICGFVYYSKADDYKVISVVRGDLYGDKDSSVVEVYTLKSNSWNCYPTVPYQFDFPYNEVLLCGALHWFVTCNGDSSRLIISFGISEEKFNEVPQTEELLEHGWTKKMGVLDECLCVIVKNISSIVNICLEVWVMRDYGVRESWSKLYIIHGRISRKGLYLEPMWSFKKGGEVLFWSDNSNPVLYDPKHESVRELNLGGREFSAHVNYFESLVSVKLGAYGKV